MKRKSLNPKIKEYGNDVLKSESFQSLKEFKQHGDVSVLSHSLRVAERSLKFSNALQKLHIQLDEKAIVRGALLHDYFLYDWHEKNEYHKLHGFTHARTALRNAEKDYELSEMEKEIIIKHMFPLNIKPPTCKEAWIVNIADTYCSTGETLLGRKPHEVRRERIIRKSQRSRERMHKRG